jgi:hypothetical protein
MAMNTYHKTDTCRPPKHGKEQSGHPMAQMILSRHMCRLLPALVPSPLDMRGGWLLDIAKF